MTVPHIAATCLNENLLRAGFDMLFRWAVFTTKHRRKYGSSRSVSSLWRF